MRGVPPFLENIEEFNWQNVEKKGGREWEEMTGGRGERRKRMGDCGNELK